MPAAAIPRTARHRALCLQRQSHDYLIFIRAAGIMALMSCPAEFYDPSPAALRPLMKSFWSASGWRTSPVCPDPEVLARSVQAGVMFDHPRAYDHDRWVKAARQAVSAVTTDGIAGAFLASLTSRRLDLRSALGSFALNGSCLSTRSAPSRAVMPAASAESVTTAMSHET